MPDYEEVIKELQKINQGLHKAGKQAREQRDRWKEKCAILLEANTKLERQMKAIKKEEAKKLSGFLKLGSDHQPIIDRTYKGK